MGDSLDDILARMRATPHDIRFVDLRRVCVAHFGQPRRNGGSRLVFAVPWPGDPRVKIQTSRGMAKRYQVLQVLKAIERLEQKRTEA